MFRTQKSGRHVNKIEFAKALSYGIANHILSNLCNEGALGSDQMTMEKLLAGYKEVTGKTLDLNSQTKADKIKLGVAGAVTDMLTSVQKGVDFKNMYPSGKDDGSKKNKNQLPGDKDMTPDQRKKIQMETGGTGQTVLRKPNTIGDSNRKTGLNYGRSISFGRPGGRGGPGVLGGSGELGGRSRPGGRSELDGTGGRSKTGIFGGTGGRTGLGRPGARSQTGVPNEHHRPGGRSGPGGLGGRSGSGGPVRRGWPGGSGGSDGLSGRDRSGRRRQMNKGELSTSMTDNSKETKKKLTSSKAQNYKDYDKSKFIANKGDVDNLKLLADNNRDTRTKGAANSGDLGKLKDLKSKEYPGQGRANNLQSSRKPGQSSKPNTNDSSQEKKTYRGINGKAANNELIAKDGKQRGKNGTADLSEEDEVNQTLHGNRRKGEMGSKNINYHPSKSDEEKGGKEKGKTEDLKKRGDRMSSGEKDSRPKTPRGKQTDGYSKDKYDKNEFGKDGYGKDGNDGPGKQIQGGKMSSDEKYRDGRPKTPEGKQTDGYGKDSFGKAGYGKDGKDDLGTHIQGGKTSSGEKDRDGHLKTAGGEQTSRYGKDGYGIDKNDDLGKHLRGDLRNGYARDSNCADTKINFEDICQEKHTQTKNVNQIECPRWCTESLKIYEASKKGSRFEVKRITKKEYCQKRA